MKRFLGRKSEEQDVLSSLKTNSSNESDSPNVMFEGTTAPRKNFNFNNDPALNLNPSILTTTVRDADTLGGKSIFSGMKTISTKQSSVKSYQSTKNRKDSFGQTLQIVDIPEEFTEGNTSEKIAEKLSRLYRDLAYAISQYNNSLATLTTAVINSIDCFKKFVLFVENIEGYFYYEFNTYNNSSLRKIMKIYLNFYDNLLKDEVYIKLKLLLVKNFNDFTKTLSSKRDNYIPQTINKPQNFAIGINKHTLPNEDVLTNIIDKISKTNISIKEQNGSFIAPILRGIGPDLSILCLYFGYPNPTDHHSNLIQSLHALYDDIHIVVMKNQIDLAATPVSKLSRLSSYKTGPSSQQQQPQPQHPIIQPTQKFKLPFRIPTDITSPPMSLSLSVENSSRTSGTMGGYIYPIIDLKKQPHLESYTNSKFAISCGHVCLDNSTTEGEYPHVSAPLSVFISLYKQALMAEYQKVDDKDELQSKVAYGAVLKQLEEMFPIKKVKVNDPKTKQSKHVYRNLPINRFGQIIWGERTLINVKDKENEKKLSDLAIIKVNKNLRCEDNFLGDDIAFNEFDPALIFDNLYVRKVIDLQRYSPLTLDLNIDEVDSNLSDTVDTYGGLSVFKYGSTTKFTSGNLNGIKLVYWLDGAIHSSEFIVNSLEKNSAFAAGGDSGSWIMTKLEDISTSKGLGVVGMLHSYDGEFKQFGLFTPMVEILQRLEEVTSIKWGVVGAEMDKRHETGSIYGGSDSENDTGFDDAYPADID